MSKVQFKVGDKVRIKGSSARFKNIYNIPEVLTIKEFTTDKDGETIYWFNETSHCALDYRLEYIHITSPVREVTKKEIIPGVYGAVTVFVRPKGDIGVTTTNVLNKDNIRATIATLTEIADALEGEKQ